jgi:flagellar assembly factor FliW
VKIETTRFGTLEIDEVKIIRMPHGMLGFPERRGFVLFPHKEGSPFFWYQSVDDPALAFVVTSPFLIVADYKVDMKDALKRMAWGKNGHAGNYELYVVVNIPKGSPEKITANLIGPILINIAIREALQMVVADSAYSHRFALLSPSGDGRSPV